MKSSLTKPTLTKRQTSPPPKTVFPSNTSSLLSETTKLYPVFVLIPGSPMLLVFILASPLSVLLTKISSEVGKLLMKTAKLLSTESSLVLTLVVLFTFTFVLVNTLPTAPSSTTTPPNFSSPKKSSLKS